MAYQPLSSLSYQGNGGLLQKAQPRPLINQPTNVVSPFSLGANKTAPLVTNPFVGTKARSPQDNLTSPATNLSPAQTQTQKPIVSQSTQNPSSNTGTSSGPTSDQVKSNLSTYYSANPQASTNPAYQTGGAANAAPNQIGTGDTTPVNPYGDSLYGKALFAQQQAQSNAANFNAGLNQEVTNIKANPNYVAPIAEGRAGLVAQTGAIQGQRLADIATNAKGITDQAFGLQYGTPAESALDSGGAGSGSSLNPINNISSLAQQVISGQTGPDKAFAMGGNVPNFQGALNAEIQKQSPGFDMAAAQGRYDAKQSNTTTAGTASTNANAAGYSPALQTYNDTSLKLNNVNDLGNLAVNTGTLGGINPFDAKYANMSLTNFRQQLSSDAQKRFDSSIATFAGAASSLLADASGQTPTGVTGLTNGVVDPNISMSALASIVDQAKKEGAIKAGNQASQVFNYKTAINGGTPQNLPGTMSAGGITYVLSPDGTYNPLK